MTKEQFEKIMTQVWDNKYEPDKLWLIIEKYTGKLPNDLLKEYKEQDYKELGSNSLYSVGPIKWNNIKEKLND